MLATEKIVRQILLKYQCLGEEHCYVLRREAISYNSVYCENSLDDLQPHLVSKW